jgi:hypothetical protein
MTGDELRILRLSLNLTQRQMADAFGAGLNTVNAWEADRANIPEWVARYGVHILSGCPDCGHKFVEADVLSGRAAPRGPRSGTKLVHHRVLGQILKSLATQDLPSQRDSLISRVVWGSVEEKRVLVRVLVIEIDPDNTVPLARLNEKPFRTSAVTFPLGHFKEGAGVDLAAAREAIAEMLRKDTFPDGWWHPREFKRPHQVLRAALRDAGWGIVRVVRGPGVIESLD